MQFEHRRPLDNIRITGVRAGTLVYRLPEGREATRDLAQVEWIAFDRWPLFNLAEKQRMSGDFRLAANTYEKTLDVLRQQAGAARPMQPADWSRDDLILLIQCRLISAYERANRFDLAVQSYLAVVERMPEAMISLRPAAMPPPQSAFLRTARQHVEQAVAGSADKEFRDQMRAWLSSWPEATRETSVPDADAPANSGAGAATGASEKPEAAQASPAAIFKQVLKDVADDIEGKAYQKSLSRLDVLGRQSPHRPAAWYYWRGRALEGLAATLPDRERRETSILGGLAYLRVVIHFPENERAPECLFRAGTICDGLGAQQQAAAVWRDLLKRWPDASPWNRMAAERMKRLKAE